MRRHLLWDYQLRGFFKEKLYSLIELGQCDLSKWNYKKAVDLFLFVNPRRIRYWRGVPILKPDGDLQRPLRAVTMQGIAWRWPRQMVEAGGAVQGGNRAAAAGEGAEEVERPGVDDGRRSRAWTWASWSGSTSGGEGLRQV